jgi:hypothetical protein
MWKLGIFVSNFRHFVFAVWRSCAVTRFPAVDGVLAVASVPADPGVPILAGGLHTGL